MKEKGVEERIYMLLAEHGMLSPRDIIELTGLSRSSVSHAVLRMVRKGLVVKIPGKNVYVLRELLESEH